MINLTITDKELKATDAIKDYIEGKLTRVEDKDLYASIDKDIDILEGQIRKTKTKREKMQKDNSLKQITISGEEEFAIEDEVIKTLHYEIKPMTMDDAKIKLREKPNNLFFTFINSDTNSVNVLYKLPDGKNFGVVEPES